MADIFTQTVQKLAEAKIASPRLEARILLAHILDCKPAEIFSNITLNEIQTAKLADLLQRRLNHEPLDKIIGKREFYKFEFITSDKVLSPRPDTETLVEQALKYILPQKNVNVLDLGTGSGCIIESILVERPSAYGIAVDISADALKTAAQNAKNLGVAKRLEFIKADWFAADFSAQIAQQFDVIVSNPPYIPTNDISSLAPEVKDYDPLLALDGGDDGFKSYRRIAKLAPLLLKPNGYILLEAGFGQADDIAHIFAAHGLCLVDIACDLAGIKRCVILKKL